MPNFIVHGTGYNVLPSPDVYFPEMDADFKNFTLSLKKQNLTIAEFNLQMQQNSD